MRGKTWNGSWQSTVPLPIWCDLIIPALVFKPLIVHGFPLDPKGTEKTAGIGGSSGTTWSNCLLRLRWRRRLVEQHPMKPTTPTLCFWFEIHIQKWNPGGLSDSWLVILHDIHFTGRLLWKTIVGLTNSWPSAKVTAPWHWSAAAFECCFCWLEHSPNARSTATGTWVLPENFGWGKMRVRLPHQTLKPGKSGLMCKYPFMANRSCETPASRLKKLAKGAIKEAGDSLSTKVLEKAANTTCLRKCPGGTCGWNSRLEMCH